jgi:hypothetical protein
MFIGTLASRQFLRRIYGTEPFGEYCRSRNLAFKHRVGVSMTGDDYARWQAALRTLPEAAQARVELELAQVNDMADPRAIAQLMEGACEGGLPPDGIPGNTALALWFLVRRPDLFREVFFAREIGDAHSWRVARSAPGIVLDDLPRRQASLARTLQQFFRLHEGIGRFCIVEAYPVRAGHCFLAHLSDRLHLVEAFTERGEHTVLRFRPVFPVFFVYEPADGKLLLKAQDRGLDTTLELFRRFGQAVLGIDLAECCLAPAFRLDLFKRRFAPSPDADDMEMVRVRALQLVYPQRSGRRRVKLETLPGDGQFAILDLLTEHCGGERVLEQLDVLYAEVQVTLRVDGRRKHYVIRLWPDRCSLDQTALGERLHACLRRWGVTYVA